LRSSSWGFSERVVNGSCVGLSFFGWFGRSRAVEEFVENGGIECRDEFVDVVEEVVKVGKRSGGDVVSICNSM